MSDELTQREKQAARFASVGLSNRQVAAHMSIKESSVKQYLHRVYGKLGVEGRTELSGIGEQEPIK